MARSLLYYVFAVLFVGFPTFMLFILSVNCFLMRRRVMGVVSLTTCLFLLSLMVFKLCNPNWSILTR